MIGLVGVAGLIESVELIGLSADAAAFAVVETGQRPLQASCPLVLAVEVFLRESLIQTVPREDLSLVTAAVEVGISVNIEFLEGLTEGLQAAVAVSL